MFEILREGPFVAPRSCGLATVDDGIAFKSIEVRLYGPQQEFLREILQPFAALPALAIVRTA